MDAIVERNRNQVFGIADLLRDICKEETGTEEVIQKVFDRYGMVMDANQYVLIGSTLRSYLSWMKGRGEIETGFRGNRLWWRAVRENRMGYGAIDRDEGGLLKDIECFALIWTGRSTLTNDGSKEPGNF